MVLQETGEGLNIQLNDREAGLVLDQLRDGSGAFEPRMLANFMAVRQGRPTVQPRRVAWLLPPTLVPRCVAAAAATGAVPRAHMCKVTHVSRSCGCFPVTLATHGATGGRPSS